MSYEVKHIIVIRKDLEMSAGEIASWAAHASFSFLAKKLRRKGKIELIDLSNEEHAWVFSSFSNIILSVNSEEELVNAYNKAIDSELTAHLVYDKQKYDPNGNCMKICVSIGPHRIEKIKDIVSEFSLF